MPSNAYGLRILVGSRWNNAERWKGSYARSANQKPTDANPPIPVTPAYQVQRGECPKKNSAPCHRKGPGLQIQLTSSRDRTPCEFAL